MYKRFITFLLIFSLIAASFQQLFVYAGFELNHNYIAKELCINRFKPQLHCNGKCYFMRKLKEAQQREANDQQTQKNLLQETVIGKITIFVFHTQLVAIINTPYREPRSLILHYPLFRPPWLG